MKKLLLAPLLLALVVSAFALAADEDPPPHMRGQQFLNLLLHESEARSQNIVVTPALVKRHDSRRDSYVINDIEKTQIGDWWVWHHPHEDISHIVSLAAENRQLISQTLSKSLPLEGVRMSYSGVELSVVAATYADLCKLGFKVPYDRSQMPGIWVTRAHPSQSMRAFCFDFGFLLAVYKIRLLNQDGGLVGRILKTI